MNSSCTLRKIASRRVSEGDLGVHAAHCRGLRKARINHADKIGDSGFSRPHS
jgi:hypothetical protein